MATVTETINLLIAQVQDTITTNGAKEIKAVDHRALLIEILEKLGELLDEPGAYLLTQFPPYVSDQLYIGGTELVVTHGGKLWAFVSEDDVTGVEPGTAVNTWYPISSLSLAHRRNRDTLLAQFTAYEVSAQEIREMLDTYEDGEGAPGKSAYEVAVENGFEGSEEEWLESLKVGKLFTYSPTVDTDGQVAFTVPDRRIVEFRVNGVCYPPAWYSLAEGDGTETTLTWTATDQFQLTTDDRITVLYEGPETT